MNANKIKAFKLKSLILRLQSQSLVLKSKALIIKTQSLILESQDLRLLPEETYKTNFGQPDFYPSFLWDSYIHQADSSAVPSDVEMRIFFYLSGLGDNTDP